MINLQIPTKLMLVKPNLDPFCVGFLVPYVFKNSLRMFEVPFTPQMAQHPEAGKTWPFGNHVTTCTGDLATKIPKEVVENSMVHGFLTRNQEKPGKHRNSYLFFVRQLDPC